MPQGPFCVRCGARLGRDPGAAEPSHRRREYAAAPHEHVFSVRLVSTLFPHLPRVSMHGFRIALGCGSGTVVLLGVLRILPVAMFAGALLVPMLTLLYLYDVDIYEDEPIRVVSMTMVWGAVAGVGVGLLTRAVTATGAAFAVQGKGTTVLDQGILLPLLGLALILLGPLALLRWRRFNDTLDGAIFGAATAAAFAAGEVITYGFSILSGGLRPAGAVLPTVARLLTIAIAIPVLEMAAVGATTGALWLRVRAPVRDRDALGVLGNPYIAAIAAAAMVAVGFSLEPLIPIGWWLASLAALDALALLWLRAVIHVGLLQEAAEIPIGPPLRCANCGEETPRHTFCINCGVSLQALPKPPPSRRPASRDRPTEAGA